MALSGEIDEQKKIYAKDHTEAVGNDDLPV